MYLGDLAAHRRAIRLDLHGTGGSARPDDLASCRCDRLSPSVRAVGRTVDGAERDGRARLL